MTIPQLIKAQSDADKANRKLRSIKVSILDKIKHHPLSNRQIAMAAGIDPSKLCKMLNKTRQSKTKDLIKCLMALD